jgi:hypothetical protein
MYLSSRRRPQWRYYRLFVSQTGEPRTERARSAPSGADVPVGS